MSLNLAQREWGITRSEGSPLPMRAVVLRQYGPADNLTVTSIPRPECHRQEVLIRVRAAGLNPIDWRIRSGSLRLLLPARFPLVLGFDVAGEIVGISPQAEEAGWQIGEAVVAFLDDRHGGGYAEYVCAGTDVLARKPSSLSFCDAASVPLAASTALQSLRDLAQLSSGMHLLINGASGGVGTFAVQLAKSMGATVTAVCSTEHLQYVQGLGADDVVDYRRDDFTLLDQKFDAVFDVAAKSSYIRCRRVLRRSGIYIRTVPSAESLFFQMITMLKGPRCRHILVRPRSEDLEWIMRKIDQGELRPEVQQVFPLEEVVNAHGTLQTGHVCGKLVLSMNGDAGAGD